MPHLTSPNDLMEAAKEHMLDGRDPESEEDWAKVVQFWAYNISHDCVYPATRLVARIFNCPLSDEDIDTYVAIQELNRLLEGCEVKS